MRGCEDRGRGRAGLKGEREHVRDAHRSGRDALAEILQDVAEGLAGNAHAVCEVLHGSGVRVQGGIPAGGGLF